MSPHVMGSGHGGIDFIFAHSLGAKALAVIFALKIAACTFSIGSGFRGGLFSASLFLGALLGGAIGTVCAAGVYEPRLQGRITRLLLNDNAPELAPAALQRIRAYAGQPPAFDTVLELEMFFRQVYQPYGWLSDAQWRHLTETSTRRLPDGRVTPHYDPAMVQQFTHHENDYLIWDHYDRLHIPVLCLRGVDSDLVLPATIAEMHRRGPGQRGLLQVVEVPGCGHAPALNVPAHFALVDGFLAAG